MEFASSSDSTSGPNAAIVPGPRRMASATCTGVDSDNGGASRPLVSAPPAPVLPWQAAQLSAYRVAPPDRDPAAGTTVGMGGPGPNDATSSTSSRISCGVYGEGLRCGFVSG